MKETAQVHGSLRPANYLEEMEALSREIESAVAAIAANKLPVLEESLRKQVEQAARCEAALLRSGPLAPGDARVHHAAKRLRASTDMYAALLLHAGQSLEMLTALHRTNFGTGVYVGSEGRNCSWQG